MHLLSLSIVFILSLAALPACAQAQSRVVGDTFKDQREQHQEKIESQTRQWLEDYESQSGERESSAAETQSSQQDVLDKSLSLIEQRKQEAQAYESERQGKKKSDDHLRAQHQDIIEQRPATWWNE